MNAASRPLPSTLTRLSLALLVTAALQGCASLGVRGEARYNDMAMTGDLGVSESASGLSGMGQDMTSSLGVGEGQGTPYLSGQLKRDGISVASSLFWIKEDSEGQLNESFGALPAGSAVAGDMDVVVAKLSATYSLDVMGIDVAPGVMLDAYSLEVSASELGTGATAESNDLLFVPMPCIRAEAEVGTVKTCGELGYRNGFGGRPSALDFEATLEWSPAPSWRAFVGYRHVDINTDGELGNGLATDLAIQGWMIGGGLEF